MNVIITGATKGIGFATMEAFGAIGANVIINSRKQAELDQCKTDFEKKFPEQQCLVYQTDMSKKEEVLAFAKFVQSSWDRIDILVNNAGVFLPGLISTEEDGQLEMQIETNVYSVYHLTRALLPSMIAAKKGHIFNLCSIASFMSYPNAGSYSISKFALLGFSKVLRSELMDKHIKVTAVMPGATWSNSWAGAVGEIPRELLMEAKDVADAIVGAAQLGPSAVIEELVIRPLEGDL